MIGKSVLCACVLLGVATATLGQSTQEQLKKCTSTDPDTRILGCTAIIQNPLFASLGRVHVGKASENLAVAYNNRGLAYSNKGDHNRAIQDYTEAIRLDQNPGYYWNRGTDFDQEGDYDRAIQDFTEALRLNPKGCWPGSLAPGGTGNCISAYVARAEDYHKKRDYDRAIQDFTEALRLNPSDARAYSGRGEAYRAKDDYDQAIQNYNEAIRLDPKLVGYYYRRGLAHHSKGDYEDAIRDFTETIRLDPKYPYAYQFRGEDYLSQSNLTAAIASFKDAISLAPSSSVAVRSSLMLHVAAKRQGQDDAQQLASVAAAADLSKWPGLILKLDLGHATTDEVQRGAANTDAKIQKQQVCEANYFTGEDALFHHQVPTAVVRLKAARDGCPKGYVYAAAVMELKRLGASASSTK